MLKKHIAMLGHVKLRRNPTLIVDSKTIVCFTVLYENTQDFKMLIIVSFRLCKLVTSLNISTIVLKRSRYIETILVQ